MPLLSAVLRAPLRLIPDQTPLPILSGPMRGMRWTTGPLGAKAWLGTYEAENQARLLALIPAGGVFYDIGANAGFFTLLGAHAVGPQGQVIAVEPNPANITRLRQHLALNHVEDRVRIVAAALTDRVGWTTFDAFEPAMGHVSAVETETTITVRATTLDQLVLRDGCPPPATIKIDVEGAELLVLTGAVETLRQYRPTLYIEPHTRAMDRACPALLESLGYTIEAFDRWPDDGSVRGWFIARATAQKPK